MTRAGSHESSYSVILVVTKHVNFKGKKFLHLSLAAPRALQTSSEQPPRRCSGGTKTYHAQTCFENKRSYS